ncbi:hypothetical protein Tco_0208147, partial [Tanacetum coccineum]
VPYQRVFCFPLESLSPSGLSGRDVVLVVPSLEFVEGNPISMGCLFPTESLGSIVVPSGKGCDLRVPSSSVEGNPVPASCMFLSGSYGSGTLPKETEWDCSEPSIGPVGSVTWVSVGVFLDLGFCLFLESAPEALDPCDLGKEVETLSPSDCLHQS